MNKDDLGSRIGRLSYEEAYEQLLDITESLESEEHSLEETMKFFENGQKLLRHCEELLTNAELKIKTIAGDSNLDKENLKNGG